MNSVQGKTILGCECWVEDGGLGDEKRWEAGRRGGGKSRNGEGEKRGIGETDKRKAKGTRQRA
jgi:hypothetical protein